MFRRKVKPIEYDADKAMSVAVITDKQFRFNPDEEDEHDKNFMFVAKLGKVIERLERLEAEVGKR